jgi:hypothetical protein
MVLGVGGCGSGSDFDGLVERELARGVAVNELFLGYELGMPKEAFYDHSWDLNRQGLVMQGPRNLTVQYELEDVLPHPAKMFYYPDFYDEKIFQMRVRFLYDGWAPWNTDLWSDSLQVHVIDLMEEWYGDGFFEYARTQESFGENVSYVKVDGTRRIVVARESDSEVLAVFTDLLAERKIEQEQAGNSQ